MIRIYIKNTIALFLLGLIAISPQLAGAAENQPLPKWELGVAAAALSVPQYIGSEQRHTLPIGAPFLIYRGDFLKSDRDGVRGVLFSDNSFNIDVGLSFGLPVKNDNNARQGMPDLNLSGQIGPRFNWTIYQPDNGPTISLHLPLRYARDIKNNNLGWVAEPSIRFDRKNLGNEGKFSTRLSTGLLYARKQYNQYYYQVQPEFATDSRAAYQAGSGLNNYFINLSGAYQLSKTLNIGGFTRWKFLNGGVVDDSPLVTDENYFAIGIGISWIFKQSE
jgi:outer membrane scaffolding protein for murein synthesis (MipA/OmpV family)